MAMELGELYRLGVRMGMENDPRPRDEIESELHRVAKRYDALKGKERERFDKDGLWNPYPDSRLLYGDEGREVNGILWGIDIGTGEIVLADRLREKGRKIDLVMGHHPRGRARNTFADALQLLSYMMEEEGVPGNVAEGVMAPRIREVHNSTITENNEQCVDAARLLDMPLMCLHSCTDVLVQRYIENLMAEKEPKRVEDVIEALLDIPEIDHMAKLSNPPEVRTGEKGRKAGKIMVKMSGGTAGPKDMYEKLADAGVGTFICMHMPEAHLEEARKHHINVVISGHMGSDSLGINLLADEVEARGVEVIPCSGLVRVRRK
ncbi:MAG: NIF3 (NGG1p interacting factor 3) [Methanomassiliicoccales archaeon PtaU1.Bin124]|nr:MAG: NIF3 (NGG1p interacting factor 3) [Methanomassiliicoccales archaeon PtaU1.Bin124]